MSVALERRFRKALGIMVYLQTPDIDDGTDTEDQAIEVPCSSGGADPTSSTSDRWHINDISADAFAVLERVGSAVLPPESPPRSSGIFDFGTYIDASLNFSDVGGCCWQRPCS